MPTEQYIPTDVKQTVEKLVKPKPSLKDLITIEQPGKPTPASQLDSPSPSKRSPRKKRPSTDKIRDVTKKDSILIITEKPQAAAKIAIALDSKARKLSENNANYYELTKDNQKIIVASAVGHLFNLTYKKGQKGYPIFQVEWVPSYNKKAAAFTKRYYDLLKKLAKRAKEFILATDYDIEGEVIGWNVLRFIAKEQTAKRMKYSTLTKDELIKAYENPMPEPDWGQAYAGETRHILDWLYGINLSRALMAAIKTTGSFKILSIGRVQGPALKIIVDREREINKFKPEPFWQVTANVKGHSKTTYTHPTDIFNKNDLEKFKTIKKADAETKDKEEATLPPVPFDLTSLQREAYRWHSATPSQTLQIAQKLYLDGVISYPRTSSQKIPDAIQPKKILKALSLQFPEMVKIATRKKPIEGKKSDPAHPCFTEDTKILTKEKEITFKEIIKEVNKWKFDPNKQSYFSDLKIPNIISHDSKNNQLISTNSYQIWKTPINKKISVINKRLEVTDNHKIYSITNEGLNYGEVKNLQKGDYIIECKKKNNTPYKIKINKINILDAFSEKQKREIKDKKNKRIIKTYQKIEKFLENMTLEKAKTLANITGFCIGDGHINYTKPSQNREKYPVSVFVGRTEDMQRLKEDITELGFTSHFRKIKDDEKHISLVSKDSAFNRILISLGCPTGDKLTKKFYIPNWIQENNELKSSFLGGLFSAELSKTRIHTKSPRDIRPYTFLQNKIKELDKSFRKYLNSIKTILKDLKIDSSEIKIKDKIIRKKDNKQTIEGSLDINNNRGNLIRFLSTINFRYCNYKEESYRKAFAYLLQRERIIENKELLKEKAKKLFKNGKKFSEISRLINISKHTIKGWLYYKKSEKEKHISTKDIPKFIDFSQTIPENCKPIKIENKISKKFKGFVYDLEIEKTHNFFANNILVHNCIFPTGEISTKELENREQQLYNLIVKRFISCFCPDLITDNRRTKLLSIPDKLSFTASGVKVKDKGWTNVYPTKIEESEIPDLQGEVNIQKINIIDKETQPPKRFSPTSLVTIMEKMGIGTKSTRSMIVDTLFERGYLDGKSIQATPLGIHLIEALEKYSPIIIDEQLTRKLEEQTDDILNTKPKKPSKSVKSKQSLSKSLKAQSTDTPDNTDSDLPNIEKDLVDVSIYEKKEQKVIKSAERIITDITKDFKAKEIPIGKALLKGIENLRKEQAQANLLTKTCPTCNKGFLRITYSPRFKRSFISCNSYPDCKQTYTLPPNGFIKKAEKDCEECGWPKLMTLRKGKRPWEFCFNPDCPTNKKRIEEYQKVSEKS